jgi:Rod binding domain-containing protein
MRIDPSIRLPLPTDEQILRYDALRQQAQKFVAQAFYTPMFKAMRASPFKSEVFSGGQGGQAFQTMFDGILAQRMTRGAGGPLVDAMVRSLDPETDQLMKKLQSRGFELRPEQVAPAYARQREAKPRALRTVTQPINLRG